MFGTRLVKPDPAARAARSDPRGLLAGVKAPAGFDVTLFAAPPDVAYPTCLAAAPDGTVFVGVDRNGSLGARPRRGEVVRCRDTDGDGKADEFKVFAKMDSPRGLWFDHNTLYVLHPPYLSAFYDDDGDGKADRSEVLVSGLGFELKRRGADHTTNGFRLGIDGWFYIAAGDYGANPARGKDGSTVQLHGGGVLRVRPDGSGLEIVSRGQRNIYDVAVSPRLDLFTRDNTNDGGGWDVRLSHVVPTGNYGYPTRFLHFAEEILPPLADYGGGAPCGALFLDEPGLPPGFGTGLYTCDWGRSEVYLHPLTPNGASWKAGQQVFLRIPRPTDIDTDGLGRLYVSSWKDGGFDYSGPNIGFVVCLTPKEHRKVSFPVLKKATSAELLGLVAGPSGVGRLYAQREMLRRGARAELVAGLDRLAAAEGPLAGRVAALFTLKQLLGERSHETLLRLAEQKSLREYALRALTDNRKELAAVPMQPFLDGLKDADARVRVQAVIGLARLGKVSAAPALLPLTADVDAIVAHVAVNALITLRAGGACLKALDAPGPAKRMAGTLRVLQELHEPAVVDGLLSRYARANDPERRRALLTVLARLYQREAEWDGQWWGTRPDTTGPYFKPVTWSESGKIAEVLRAALKGADGETLRWLLPLYQRLRVNLPEITPVVLKLAGKGPELRRLAVEMLVTRRAPPAEAIPLLSSVAATADEKIDLRLKALRGLVHLSGSAAARDGLIAGLTATEQLPRALEPVWSEFVRDGRHVGAVAFFAHLATAEAPARRELAYGVLATIAGRSLGSQEARAAAAKVVNEAWKDRSAVIPLLHAVRRLHLSGYTPEVRRLLADANPQIAAAAKNAALALKLDGARSNEPVIGKLKYEQVVARVKKSKGDTTLGRILFQRIGCINCHTVSASEAPKGPFLGGISTRYSKDELLESILKPSAKIAQGFETNLLALTNGRVQMGFVVRESGTEVELRDSTGATTVVKKVRIEERTKSKVSVMPEKLVDDLTPRELASILAYLESLKGK